jgi:XapX domain-containing protein
MKEIVLSLLAGIICGLIFKLLKLPLPAPPVLAGVIGIVGVYLGGKIFDILIDFLH